MWLSYKPIDVESDDNTGIFHVVEIQIRMNA